jgi:hypothetical protein
LCVWVVFDRLMVGGDSGVLSRGLSLCVVKI